MKKHLKEQNPFVQQITIHILVMSGPPFFLADLSQPFGYGGPTSAYTLHLCSSSVRYNSFC
jgi:hypothetical protein